MAVDRTWYNTLVDDDGSGLTGSVWDKADVDALLDAVDAEIARLDTVSTYGTFTPTLLSAGGGTPTYVVQQGIYARAGKLVNVSGNITLASKGSLAAGALAIGGFPFANNPSFQGAALVIGYYGGLAINIAGLASYFNPGTYQHQLTYNVPGAGSTGIGLLDGTMITGGFTCIWGGTYYTAQWG